MAENKFGKTLLHGTKAEFPGVVRIGAQPERYADDERRHRRYEAGQERIERERAGDNEVQHLEESGC